MNDKKFEYFNTVGGFVLNHEIDRVNVNGSNRIKRSYMDDAYSVFFIFYGPIFASFQISKSISSNEFVELHEKLNGKKFLMERNTMFVAMVV